MLHDDSAMIGGKLIGGNWASTGDGGGAGGNGLFSLMLTMRRGARAARALIILGDIVGVIWGSFEVIEDVTDDSRERRGVDVKNMAEAE